MAQCRIQNIMPRCGYQNSGIDSIRLLDFEDFDGFRFEADRLYDIDRVTAVFRSGDFADLPAGEPAKYTSALQDGIYTHTLETFAEELSAEVEAALHLATKRRYLVVFRSKSGKYHTFGYEAGAVVTYADRTDEGAGVTITITVQSTYPLFEVIPEVFEAETQNVAFEPDFETGAYCVKDGSANTGYLQAVVVRKVSAARGEALDIQGNLVRRSGKKQAIALLLGRENPAPERYEVEFRFNEGAVIEGTPSVSYNSKICPLGVILEVEPDAITLSRSKPSAQITVRSSSDWRILPGPTGVPNTDIVDISAATGPKGVSVITATLKTGAFGTQRITFTNEEGVTAATTVSTTLI